MNKEAKRETLEAFISNLSRLSDENYQERVWVRVEGPECDDIDDAVGDFFDDGDHILEDYKNFDITEKLIQLPEWKEIRELAKDIIQAFG